jgi:UPF0755 protein
MKKIWLIVLIFSIIGIFGAYFAYQYYSYIYHPNISISDNETRYIYIPSGANYQQVKDSLNPYLNDETGFDWVAEKKEYPNNIKPGKYQITNGMSNNTIINILRSGQQTPVMLTFNNIRTLTSLSAILGNILEPDSAAFIEYFSKPEVMETFGFNRYSFPAMFLPDSYEFYWNTSPEAFTKRMKSEYDKFWNSDRLEKAAKLNLSLVEIISLASIVEAETKKNDEKPRVAGVYINRIRKNMPLQADPTLVFAHGDFSIRRVLNVHKEIMSPYNTYRNIGIPPGPINLPEKTSIDAVLNFEKHDYLFFCAKPDYSGYHNFSKTNRQHEAFARQYRQFLNREKIYR